MQAIIATRIPKREMKAFYPLGGLESVTRENPEKGDERLLSPQLGTGVSP